MHTRTFTTRTFFRCTAAVLALFAGAAASSGQCTGTKITADDAQAWDRFASSVAMSSTASGPVATFGMPLDDTAEGNAAGSVYVFTRVNGVWGQTNNFYPNDLNTDFHFGHAVGYADPCLIVAAPRRRCSRRHGLRCVLHV